MEMNDAGARLARFDRGIDQALPSRGNGGKQRVSLPRITDGGVNNELFHALPSGRVTALVWLEQ
jgi:hypothetical protein